MRLSGSNAGDKSSLSLASSFGQKLKDECNCIYLPIFISFFVLPKDQRYVSQLSGQNVKRPPVISLVCEADRDMYDPLIGWEFYAKFENYDCILFCKSFRLFYIAFQKKDWRAINLKLPIRTTFDLSIYPIANNIKIPNMSLKQILKIRPDLLSNISSKRQLPPGWRMRFDSGLTDECSVSSMTPEPRIPERHDRIFRQMGNKEIPSASNDFYDDSLIFSKPTFDEISSQYHRGYGQARRENSVSMTTDENIVAYLAENVPDSLELDEPCPKFKNNPTILSVDRNIHKRLHEDFEQEACEMCRTCIIS